MDEQDHLIDRLRSLGRQPVDATVAAHHLRAIAGFGGRTGRAVKFKVGAALLAGFMLGGAGLATAGALPGPAQNVARTALSKMGLDVPTSHGPARYNDPKCGTDPNTHQAFKNHGQYVRVHKGDPNAGSSRCGKPIQAAVDTTNDTEAPGTGHIAPPGVAHGKKAKGKPDQPTDGTTESTSTTGSTSSIAPSG
jgi:hypothetical protein